MTQDPKFRVEIKDSAVRENRAAEELLDREGEIIEYESRLEAEKAAEDLSIAADGRVAIQSPPKNEPEEIDAYLVYSPVQRKQNPDGSFEEGWTFDITANQYGALGETLITAPGTPALKHFVFQDLSPFPCDDFKENLRINVIPNRDSFDWERLRSAVDGEWLNWTPDCEIRIKHGYPSRVHHQYFCEIKTGDASFQRNQVQDMEAVSEVLDVLKIRVKIEELPEEYSVRIRRVGDSDADPSWDDKIDGSAKSQADFTDF